MGTGLNVTFTCASAHSGLTPRGPEFMAQTILVVDDDPVQRRLLETAITRNGMTVLTAPGGQPALDLINGPRGDQINLMMLDLVMPDMGGLEVLARLRASNPDLPVIVLTAKGGIDSAVEAMRAGANDFLVKPASPERIAVSMRNQLKIGTLSGEVKQLKKKAENRLSFDDLVAESAEMKQVFKLGERAAQSNIPILIEGESGAGKELIARAIQGSSERAGKSPFVTVNCGAIPENLIESILFGHEKGRVHRRLRQASGQVPGADGGTLFLDEIGDLRLDMQVKLLRALQEGEVDPVGSKRPVKVDVRIISATNRDLAAMAKDGSFREDLFYRPERVPHHGAQPARPRRRYRAAGALFHHPLRRRREQAGRGHDPGRQPVAGTLHWPGNVRQLENTIFRRRGAVRRHPAGCGRFPARSPPPWGWSPCSARATPHQPRSRPPRRWPPTTPCRWRRLIRCRSPMWRAMSANSRIWNARSSAAPSPAMKGHMSKWRGGLGHRTLNPLPQAEGIRLVEGGGGEWRTRRRVAQSGVILVARPDGKPVRG